jgi:excinuclease ABC subunit A
MQKIILKRVRVHNLKSVDLTLERQELIVFTGVSGSGKSSLAFDTLYVEGQRRYVESLSTYARRQLGELSKPDIESASGISPTISIEQKTAGRNPRSTVGTLTDIYDYMRILYARVGVPHCPISGEAVLPQSRERIIKTVQSLSSGTKIIILAPYARGKKAEFKEDFQELLRKGFTRVRIDGKVVSLENETTLDGNLSHDVDIVIDRITMNEQNASRVAESITQALQWGKGLSIVLNSETGEEQLFSMHAYSPKSGLSYQSLEPQDFSFNSPTGMCPKCHGMGNVIEFNLDKIINPNLSIAEDCCSVATSYQTVRYGNIYDNLARIYDFSVNTPWKKLSDKAKQIFLYGTGDHRWLRMHFVHPEKGYSWVDRLPWRGVLYEAHQRYAEAKSENYRKKMADLLQEQICPECKGHRLKPYPAATELCGKRISEVTQMTVADCFNFFEHIPLSPQDSKIADDLLKEIRERLKFLIQVGLHYITLDRTSPTLSGGEAQRVRLASQIGSGLVGITYILDEPSIGLHPRDNQRLIATLQHLRDIGNTVIVVEHDEETMWAADRIVDLGPGPGIRGGEIIVNGTLKDLLTNTRSITASYLSGKMSIPIPSKRRKGKDKKILEVIGAAQNNLKNINVKIPLGVFICITGVSGSGKSSLISEILYPALNNTLNDSSLTVGKYKEIRGIENINKVIAIDQSPIGRNPRSNPATYIKVFDEIRDLFSQLPESKARGYKSGRFSFNVKEGSCSQCEGMGSIKIDMDFMEDAWVECPLCKGKRFDPETLSVYFKGKNIYDVLEMEVAEALVHFANIPSIKHKLETLQQVGMEYIKLGQSSTTLSGGEAQRIKLARELVRPATGDTLYIFDEPTTGLHIHDVKHLLEILHELVNRGNTVIVIEHNMDVVKTADWIIDLGPEGGIAGGYIVDTGTPEKIAKQNTPTGHAVSHALFHDNRQRIAQAMETESKRKRKQERYEKTIQEIIIQDAEQNNLKHLDLHIPRGKITICTGPSGSGKSSLAFDTIYAEGQRRYIESLSPYARQFVKQMPKPKVGHVDGLSPSIAIEQKAHAGNPRSTVGTMTEIYDYLRVLYARLGVAHSPETGEIIQAISKDFVVEKILSLPKGEKIQILAPIELRRNDKFEEVLARFQKQGYLRIRLNRVFYELDDLEKIPFDRKNKNELMLVVDRIKVDPSIKLRLLESITNAASLGNNQVVIFNGDAVDHLYNLSFAVASTGQSYKEITPHTFAFNVPEGMCPDCEGLGYQYGANLAQKNEVMDYSVAKLMQSLWYEYYSSAVFKILQAILKNAGIDDHKILRKLTSPQLQWLMNGAPENQWYNFQKGCRIRWTGINFALARAIRHLNQSIREAAFLLLDTIECPSCQGARINALARHVTIQDVPIQELCRKPIDKALQFIQKIELKQEDNKILLEVQTQLINRLKFLSTVGLDYLSLNRPAPSLSGGEAQRIRLARQLGSGLTGVLYVLDEPTIGLHPRDNDRLNQALRELNNLGNTMIIVEHDPLTVEIGDHILDFGPQSGEQGGYVVAQGTLSQIKKNPRSLTGLYLSGKLKIPIPSKRREGTGEYLSVEKATLNNLKKLNVNFPVGVMTCLTGVSGSGKSTLLHQIVQPAIEKGITTGQDIISTNVGSVKNINQFDKILSIDQNPVGHTVRSDVGTYVEVLSRMRDFFSMLPLARSKGLLPKNFSFNHRHGMCTNCQGLGYRRVEMQFLPPIKVICEECHGLRLNPVSLEIVYSGKNFGQYLDTTVEDARKDFEHHRRITRILDTLIDVGLGYLKLGQEVATLSGGEAQRIKLSRELAKRSTGKTLYLMDEPTTGLHQDDIAKLLKVLHKLVDNGNTMIIIEHNLEIIKNADWIIEMGPEAGDKGGQIVCQNTPEQLSKHPTSWTARYLSSLIQDIQDL